MSYFTIRIRGDTKSNWEFYNPILADREVAMEKDPSGKTLFKIGDGVTEWNNLDYVPYISKWDTLSGRSIGDVVPSFRSLSNPPSNCMPAIGAELNRADYPELYKTMVEDQAPGEDWISLYGGTLGLNFGTPDLRRQFLRGSGIGFGVGSIQQDAFKEHDHGGGVHTHNSVASTEDSHNHGFITNGNGSHTHTGTTNNSGGHSHMYDFFYNRGGYNQNGLIMIVDKSSNGWNVRYAETTRMSGYHTHPFETSNGGDHSHTGNTNSTSEHTHEVSIHNSKAIVNKEGTNETRPVNTAINYFFVYK